MARRCGILSLVSLPAAAFRADQRLAPVGHGQYQHRTARPSLGRIGLDLVLADFASHDEPNAHLRGIARASSADPGGNHLVDRFRRLETYTGSLGAASR